MKKLLPILLLTAACQSAAPPAIVTAPIGLIAGPEVDRQINKHLLGSTTGKTITSDDDDARKKGDTAAASRCQVYDFFLWPFDMVYSFFYLPTDGDHCARWNKYEISLHGPRLHYGQ